MARHTDGPWENRIFTIRDGRERIIADVCVGARHGGVETREEWEANAALIASAPELLEALQAVDEWYDVFKQCYPEMLFRDKVRAAIAKARGEVTG